MSLDLYLVRHAEAASADRGIEDFERALNERGRREAAAMALDTARLLAGYGPTLLSSPAVRAITTARRFAEALGVDGRAIRIDARLYEASAGDWVEVLREQPTAAEPLIAFGHNPGISELAGWLCAELRGRALPTAARVGMRMRAADWSTVDRDGAFEPKLCRANELSAGI